MQTTWAQSGDLPEAACRVLHEERAKYPSNLLPLCEEAGNPECPLGKILNAAAIAGGNGLGLSRKETGFYVVSPAGRVASDVLMLQNGTYWDVFIAGEERGQVSCGGSDGVITDSRRGWVAPVLAMPEPDPDPEPTPDPEEPLPTEVLLAMKLLLEGQARQISLLEMQIELHRQQTDALQRAIIDLRTEIARGIKIRW